MVDIQNYLNLSKTASSISIHLTIAEEFSENYKNINEKEKDSFLRHYIVNNCPYIFNSKPILFEQIIQYLADKLEINASEVKLIGSAKTGFSISYPPNYGRLFTKDSDLDFSIVNEDLFLELEEEFNSWADQYRNKIINPKNDIQTKYWDLNLFEVPEYQLKNGLIDTYKIPNTNEFPIAKNINNSLSLIVINLKGKHSIEVKGASVRVYRSWKTFSRQIKLNTTKILNETK
ncbi:MAG: hypothetical protein JNJ41_05200 [Bacteroidia bacterium]|nr:hypothetical protein [Bacteroidia bacterium]